jgi:hypothetical protein
MIFEKIPVRIQWRAALTQLACFSLLQLIGRRRRAGTANQPIRLFQNVGIFRLFSGEEADDHERRAKQQA